MSHDPATSDLWVSADALGEALHALRMTGLFYCRSELTEPWGLFMPPMANCLWFHAVMRGECRLGGEGLDAARLTAGDFVLVPHRCGHTLKTQATVRVPDVVEMPQEMVSPRYSIIRHGGGGSPTTLICGMVRFDDPAASRIVRLMPPAIRLSPTDWLYPDWVEITLRMMEAEAARLRPGGETMMTRLADVLIIQAVRAWLESDPAAQSGWLGAMRDEQIGPAIALAHRDPSRRWTVEALASAAAMSRSAFAARFMELVGETPMLYLTRLRMEAASAALTEGNATVGELAAKSGYQSEAAFSRAFKRMTGLSPGAVRRQLRTRVSTHIGGPLATRIETSV